MTALRKLIDLPRSPTVRTDYYVRLTWLLRFVTCVLVGLSHAYPSDAVVALSDTERSTADRLALSILFDDKHLADNVMAVRRRAAALPSDQKYEYLANWVLPGRDHATFRLNGLFGQTNPPPPVAEYLPDEQERLDNSDRDGSGRIQTGGIILAPACDLIHVAKQLGRLDALRKRVESGVGAGVGNDQKRARIALLILIDVAQKDFESARTRFEEFSTAAMKPPFLAGERWPELLVFAEALRHRQTYRSAGEVISALIDREIRRSGGSGSNVFDRHLLALSGLKRHFDDGHSSIDAYFDDAPAKQWSPVSRVSAETRGQGMPVARWSAKGKSAFSFAGHDSDFLYFQSPLRGNYELDCQVTFYDWRGTHLMAGGKWVAPVSGLSHFHLGSFRRGYGWHRLDPPMWNRNELDIHYRVTVRDRVATTFFNGRKIHEEPLGAEHDPWVGIRSDYKRFGGVLDLRITGDPIIPRDLTLLHNAALTGWVPYYGESIGNDDSNWRFDAEELIGRRQDNGVEDENRESLIYYHRPMLEDGSIEYEFFYQTDESHVHPALDRLVFLLEEEGVRVHWCTDGDYDRTGLPKSNAFDESDNQRGPNRLPLKPGEWNGLKLALAGKTVTLHLNGEMIYQRDLEPSNQRQFGLFHFRDRSAARVRNIVWRGSWPLDLPPLEDQELADISLVTKLNAKLPQMAVFEHDFSRDGLQSDVFQLESTVTGENAATAFVPQSNGVHVTRPGINPNGWYAFKLEHRFRLSGDFDITASFHQLETTLPAEGQHNGVGFNVLLDCDPYIRLWLRHLRSGDDRQFVGTTSQHRRVDGGIRWDYWKNLPNNSRSGALRLVRRDKTIYYLFAEGDSTQFRLHRKQELSDAPVQMNGLKLLTQTGGIGQTSVVWKRVTILADQITPDPTEHRRTTVAAFARQLTGPWPESALEFDGGKAHVVIPTLNYDGSYAITYEAFVTPDVLENVFIADTQRSGAGFGVRKTGYTLHAWNGSAYQSVFADQPATRYLRVHVAATLQDGQLRVFVNGKRQTAATRLTDGKFAASRFPMIVGASPSPFDSGIDNPFTGVIDGVRISKGVRYTDDFTVPIELEADETTIAAYRFNEGQGQTLSDSSGNSHDGQIKGAKWVTGTAIRSRAARGLVDFGRHAVTELVEGLSHENAIVRLEAAIALGRIGRDAKQAVAALERAAADDDQRVRAAAVRAIARIELNGDAQ